MDLNCPYCDAELEVCHDDDFGYEEGIKHEMQCYICDKNFVFETSICFYYEPIKVDCLNGGEHEYELTATALEEFSKMRCKFCEDERELTEKERVDFCIGTKESYFDRIK